MTQRHQIKPGELDMYEQIHIRGGENGPPISLSAFYCVLMVAQTS